MCLLALTPHAHACTPALRAARHGDYTRLVFAGCGAEGYAVRQAGGAITIALPPGVVPSLGAGIMPGLALAPGQAVLILPAGATLRSFALADRRVLDIVDAAAATPPVGAAIAPGRIAPIHLRMRPGIVMAPLDIPTIELTDAAPPPPDPASDPVVLPLPKGTGAAALARADEELIVFDTPAAFDPAPLRALPGVTAAEVTTLPRAVLLRLRLAPGRAIALARDGIAWTVQGIAAPVPAADEFGQTAAVGRLVLTPPAGAPGPAIGNAVTIADPLTGDALILGTMPAPGAHVGTPRHLAEFDLLATQLGVAIAPLAARVALRAEPADFAIESASASQPLALAALAAPDPLAAGLSRSFDLPDQPAETLLRRLQAQTLDATRVPPLARLPYRRAMAQTLLALGLGPEAMGVADLAATDDPRAAADPQLQAIAGAAAVVAARPERSGALAVTDATETDEHRLWRALRQAWLMQDGAAPDGPTLAALAQGLPLLLSYPDTLASRLAPMVVDRLLRGGAFAAAAQLMAARPHDRALDLARAVLLQAQGQNQAALADYDALALARDRSVHARAAVAAVTLRLALGQVGASAAADAADKLLYAWRGDGRERALRLQEAAWLGQAHRYRDQLGLLRETIGLFPETAPTIRAAAATAFAALLNPHGPANQATTPLDFIALVQDNLDLLPDGAQGEMLANRLADALAALDLPSQAAGVLGDLLGHPASPAARAALGARLASLDLDAGAAPDALTALARSEAQAALSPSLAAQRAVLAARAQQALGNSQAAVAALPPQAAPGADTAQPMLLSRADVEEDARNWPAAAADLTAYDQHNLPPSGPLDQGQSGLVLRLASALAQANDLPGLGRLRDTYGARLPDRNDVALLGLLTQSPILDPADLPRAAAETEAARAVPRALQGVGR